MTTTNEPAVEERDGTKAGTKEYHSYEVKIVNRLLEWPDDRDGERITDEEVADVMAMVDEWRANQPPTQIDWEQAIQDSVEAHSQIRMFDYGTGKMSNVQAMADFYGWAIVRQIEDEIEYSYNHRLDDQKPGHISKKLWRRIKDIRAGRLPKAAPIKYKNKCKDLKPRSKSLSAVVVVTVEDQPQTEEKPKIKVVKRKRQKGDDYFLPLERGIIRNETYRKLFKGPGVVYEWLWANIVRDQWRDSKAYPIKEKYYEQGYLAYCSTYRTIAKACFMSKNTVQNYVKNFEETGIIKTKTYVPNGKTQGQTVFILGKWKKVNGEIIESRYFDKVFITPKPVKN